MIERHVNKDVIRINAFAKCATQMLAVDTSRTSCCSTSTIRIGSLFGRIYFYVSIDMVILTKNR